MKIHSLSTIAFAITMLTVAPACIAQSSAEEKLIQNIIQEEITTWNKGDAAGYSKSFAQDGTFTNIRGEFYKGHQSFLERHDQIFKTIFKGTTLQTITASLKFIKSDVAIIETVCWVSGFVGTPPPMLKLDAKNRLVTRLLQVMQKDGNDWKIVAYHNVAVAPGSVMEEPK